MIYRKALLGLAVLAFAAAHASAQVEVPFRVPVAPIATAPVFIPRITVPTLSALSTAASLPLAATVKAPLVPSPVLARGSVAKAGGVARSAAERRPWRLIITGPPGSGKGTYAKRLSDEYGPVHISAGALLRDYAVDHPDIRAIMERGDLVPAALVVDLVRRRLEQEDVRRSGFLLDGFPRRVEEASALDAMLESLGMPLDAVIFLDVPEEELLRRILARGRADDNESTFRERMRVYREETVPVFNFLRGRAPFLSPSVAAGDPDAAYAEVRRSLDAVPR